MKQDYREAYADFICELIRQDREFNEALISKLCSALEQCKYEVERCKRFACGKKDFHPTKGMRMAEAVLKEVRGDA